MSRLWWDMTFKPELGCWVAKIGDQEMVVHAGDCFDLSIDEERGLPCRLERVREWYLIIDGQLRKLESQDTFKIDI